MHALNQTIYEKKEIHSIVTNGTIIDIKHQYQCEENNGPRYRSHYLLLTFCFNKCSHFRVVSYQNNNSDENPKSPDVCIFSYDL